MWCDKTTGLKCMCVCLEGVSRMPTWAFTVYLSLWECSDLLFGMLLFEGGVLNEGSSTLLVVFLRVRQELNSLLQGHVWHIDHAVHPAETGTGTLVYEAHYICGSWVLHHNGVSPSFVVGKKNKVIKNRNRHRNGGEISRSDRCGTKLVWCSSISSTALMWSRENSFLCIYRVNMLYLKARGQSELTLIAALSWMFWLYQPCSHSETGQRVVGRCVADCWSSERC